MRSNQSLSVALILTSIIFVWNAFGAPMPNNGEEIDRFDQKPQTEQDRTSLVSMNNFGGAVSVAISNSRLSEVLKSSLPENSCVQAFVLKDATFRADPIIDLRGNLPLIPASTNKYLTAAVVLSSFSKDTTLDTEMFAESRDTQIDRAYLKTVGDPSFVSSVTRSPRRPEYLSPTNTRTFSSFAIDISKSGVKSIKELVVDSKWFELPQIEAGWAEDKLEVGQIAAMNIDEGFEGNELSGDPNLFAVRTLVNAMAAQGVVVDKISIGSIPAELQTNDKRIGKSSSSTVETLVSDMLKTSDNVYAEQLLAASVRTSFEKVNIETRSKFVMEKLGKLGIGLDGFKFENGSGYSREARLTCSQQNELIRSMQAKNIDLPGLASIAGVDGTLKLRFKGNAKKLKAKTGTLNGVSGLSGRLNNKFVFTFIANSDFDLEQGHSLQEVVVANLDAYPSVSEPNF